MKFKKGDTVLIISGKDKGKRGKILKVFPKESKILVEGINLRKKHQKPRRTGEKGQIVEMPASIYVSNTKLICPKCGKPTRISYGAGGDIPSKTGNEIRGKKKYRICKKCGQEI